MNTTICPECHATAVSGPDREGLIDCLACGIWWEPTHPNNQIPPDVCPDDRASLAHRLMAQAEREHPYSEAEPATEEDALLLAVIEDYVEGDGLWYLVTYPGVYDILKLAFADGIAEKRALYAELEAAADNDYIRNP